MKKTLILAATLFAAQAFAVTDGGPVAEGEGSNFVMWTAEGQYCTATLLNPYVSITANHCGEPTVLYGDKEVHYFNLDTPYTEVVNGSEGRSSYTSVAKHDPLRAKDFNPIKFDDTPPEAGHEFKYLGYGGTPGHLSKLEGTVSNYQNMLAAGCDPDFSAPDCFDGLLENELGTQSPVWLTFITPTLGWTTGGDSGSTLISNDGRIFGLMVGGGNEPVGVSFYGDVTKEYFLIEVDGLAYPGLALPGAAIEIQNLSLETIPLNLTGAGTCPDTLEPADVCTMIMPADFSEWKISNQSHELYDYTVYNAQPKARGVFNFGEAQVQIEHDMTGFEVVVLRTEGSETEETLNINVSGAGVTTATNSVAFKVGQTEAVFTLSVTAAETAQTAFVEISSDNGTVGEVGMLTINIEAIPTEEGTDGEDTNEGNEGNEEEETEENKPTEPTAPEKKGSSGGSMGLLSLLALLLLRRTRQ
ncbi:GlyGly-CTERM sorting domain-containing protein [Ferrimonas marina]|uniref:GlyGly-CTERM domain-containing protein n=1 Tax=Ferrimonas marina TaxID=299255 RepID=A0A1M5TKN0_9GAMM|nr:GlyGly-CTERM sorting domain-containing protein [Ferrimonas marina]SHH51239.1 GlyGly-CTERM domain-containing protein [Ferrimonas marina]